MSFSQRIKDFYRVISTTIHPTNSDIAYICTQDDKEGLQYSENFTSTSPTFSRVNSYHFSNPIKAIFNPYNTNEIWITSFGNGLKKGIVDDGSLGFENAELLEVSILENPFQDAVQINFGNEKGSAKIFVINQLGQIVADFTIDKILKTHQFPLHIKSGMYYLKATLSNGKKRTFKIIKKYLQKILRNFFC